MSIETWEEKYYPIPANLAISTELKAIEHCLIKWGGLEPEILEEHSIEPRFFFTTINSKTCALCCRHRDTAGNVDCKNCTLNIIRGVPCYVSTREAEQKSIDDSPFHAYKNSYNPESMIKLLKVAKKFCNEKVA